MTRITLCVINDLTGDQRLHRIASSLGEGGYQVTVVGRRLSDSLPIEKRPYQTHRMRLLFTKGKLFYLEYTIRLFFYLLLKPKSILNANDLDTLLACFLAGKIRGMPVVYDSHEYFTEVPELIDRAFTRNIWVKVERWLFPKVAAAYTVNQSLATIYADLYKREVGMIRNLPVAQSSDSQGHTPNLLIYQGALNVSRGIELMIAAMEHLPAYSLWIIGKGDVEADLKEQAEKSPAWERIIFKGFVPLEKLNEYTCQASLGFSLEEDRGKNYHFASPNKVYDYIQAGVPVIVSDLPEMSRLVSEYRVGEVLPDEGRTPKALARKVRAMTQDTNRYETYVSRCRKAAKELTWENEKQKLLEIYQPISQTLTNRPQ